MTKKEYTKLKNTLYSCFESVAGGPGTTFEPVGAGLLCRDIIELENHARKYGFTDHKLED